MLFKTALKQAKIWTTVQKTAVFVEEFNKIWYNIQFYCIINLGYMIQN